MPLAVPQSALQRAELPPHHAHSWGLELGQRWYMSFDLGVYDVVTGGLGESWFYFPH